MTAPQYDLNTLEAIVFDFDGVILESGDIKTQGFRELFAGVPEHQDAIVRHHLDNLGISRFEKFEWIYSNLLGASLSAEEAQQLGRRYSQLVYERALRCPLVPGARRLLDDLQGRLPMFVASGTPQEELARIVAERELSGYFVEVCGSPETKENTLRRLLGSYQLDPSKTILVGDGLSDLRAAQLTGVGFVARVHAKEPLFDWPEDTVQVADLTGLLTVLGLRESPSST